MISAAVLALLTAWTNWASITTTGTSARVVRSDGATVLQIYTPAPADHLSGLVMRTSPPVVRNREPQRAVTGYYLDRGIFTYWRFVGSNGADTLEFGPQGHIISKRNGGVVDFRADSAPDRFVFTNQIDVAKCSEKHGFPCHPLNHLQRVVVKNFGREDRIILQGRVYRYADVKGGVLPGVPVDRLRVELMP